ncbi:MAG: cob(I)yrinic acid a,c-diamide adenosyltransferase [Oscillospiraceae bacterium]
MVHIYCGDGKGKTTCAMGLAVRAAGHGRKVVVAQFLKGNNSGERAVLESLPTVNCLPVPETIKFIFAMDEQEKAEARAQMTAAFAQAVEASRDSDLLVLDELCGAITTGMVPLEDVLAFLDNRPEGLEVVITGRDPASELQERADYITEMRKVKHPFDKGVNAREGIEW